MLRNDLEGLGLNKNEALTYLALQETGKTKAGQLIKDTGLHRNLVYLALTALAQKQLVTKTTTGSVALFQATDPIHLLDDIRERELTAERVIDELKTKKKIVDQEITIYEGAEGMRAFNLKNAESLKGGETIYVLGSGGHKFEKAMGARALKKYFSLVEKNGNAKILMYQSQQYTPDMYSATKGKSNFAFRILPFNMNPSAGVVFTKHSVAFHIYEEPIAVIEIKNPHLVEVYHQYFEVLWNQEVRVENGIEAIQRAFGNILEELKSGDEYYSIGTQTGEQGSELARFFENYHKLRVDKGVACKLLSYKQDTETLRKRFHGAGDGDERISHVKPLSQSATGFIQVMLYNNKVFIPIYGERPLAIVFENKQLFNGFKQYFDELWNQQTQNLDGASGLRELCEAVLREKQDLYLIAATGTITKLLPDYYKVFTDQCRELGINIHMLANESIRDTAATKPPISTVSYLPPEFESPMVVWVFGEYVANVLWQEPAKIFLTRDKSTADSYHRYYSALKKISQP